jgi:hypothetical protein
MASQSVAVQAHAGLDWWSFGLASSRIVKCLIHHIFEFLERSSWCNQITLTFHQMARSVIIR